MKSVAPCSSEAVLSKIWGTIDRLLRPVVRLETSAGESFLALVDTGFNGELMLALPDAQALGFEVSIVKINALLAGDVAQKLREGSGNLNWLGKDRRIELMVSPASNNRRMDDDPIALIGTRLLTPHLLLIDFKTLTLEIEAQN
jgi:predicted aspartyl protease